MIWFTVAMLVGASASSAQTTEPNWSSQAAIQGARDAANALKLGPAVESAAARVNGRSGGWVVERIEAPAPFGR